MKPVASTMTEIDHMPGEEVKFSISSANSAWVMRSMADLYSNRELACVREYSTNAYDSNKEKALRDGHPIKPIEVKLPSSLQPYFEVQDFGVGMSEKELKEVYTQFGESTKRESDEFNGMLGFGSKSAIAYTNTFTVTSVKDGMKTVAVITRREDAMGGYLVTLKVILNVATSEPSGVHIQIPVHNHQEFTHKANDFYRFWEPGRVLVNGKAPVWSVGDKIEDNLYYNAQVGTSYVVMGNVPYRIANPDALFPPGMNKINFVAYVPLGAVEFTPSREDLKYSEHTKKNLHGIIDNFVKKAVNNAKKEIAQASSHYAAYVAWNKWRNILGASQVSNLTYKGDKLVDEFPIKGERYHAGYSRQGTTHVNGWRVAAAHEALFITGFDIDLNSAHKKKVTQWLNFKNNFISPEYYIFTAAKSLDTPWVDPNRIIDWDTLKKEIPKQPRQARASVPSGRLAGSFDLITRKGRKPEKDVPSAKPLYFIMVKEYNGQRNLEDVLEGFKLDHEVVLVPANRLDKFKRFYPHAEPILPELKKMVKTNGMKLISKEGLEYLTINNGEVHRIGAMDPAKVDDPEIKRLIALCKKPESDFLVEYSANMRLAANLGVAFQRHSAVGNSWNRSKTPLLESYPLAANFSRIYDPKRSHNEVKKNEHVYTYMNAVYAARKDGKTNV